MANELITVLVTRIEESPAGDIIHYTDCFAIVGRAFTGVNHCLHQEDSLLKMQNYDRGIGMVANAVCELCSPDSICFAIPTPTPIQE